MMIYSKDPRMAQARQLEKQRVGYSHNTLREDCFEVHPDGSVLIKGYLQFV